jgi:hypothetical protein
MKHQYHFGSANNAAPEYAAKVVALINELERRVRILESDIAKEEDLAGVSNPFDAAYPILARVMAARRDNLKQTIAALEQRLSPELAQTA